LPGNGQDFELAMAFQPIVDIETGAPFAYEALVRGPHGKSAGGVLAKVNAETRYASTSNAGSRPTATPSCPGSSTARLSINSLPNAVYSPVACVKLTLQTARKTGFPTERLFEFTKNEWIDDPHM
jgi:EAL domain-containing protein (putative c-di-GMP-specific phosphodiesterase class I)